MRDWHKTSGPGCTWAYSRIRAVALIALAVQSLSGCFQVRGLGDAGRAPIVDVQIVNLAEQRKEAAAEIADDALKPTLRKMMDGWPDFAFRVARSDEAGWQLTVRLAQLTERTADPSQPTQKARSAGVSLQLRALGPVQGERSTYSADLLLARTENEGTPIEALVQDALRAAGDRLMRFRSVQRADETEVVAALNDDDEAVRTVAIQTAAERRLEAAIPVLIERLKAPDQGGQAVVSIVGALASMQARQATDAIIDTARRQNRSYLVPLLYALAQLGGRKAQAYLFTVQSGHPDPVVKRAASEALAELERRAASGSP